MQTYKQWKRERTLTGKMLTLRSSQWWLYHGTVVLLIAVAWCTALIIGEWLTIPLFLFLGWGLLSFLPWLVTLLLVGLILLAQALRPSSSAAGREEEEMNTKDIPVYPAYGEGYHHAPMYTSPRATSSSTMNDDQQSSYPTHEEPMSQY